MSTPTTPEQAHPHSASAAAPPRESVKETLISIIIAFVLAFVFRGFVIEAFVIPTGSMAPTLMGAHMRFRSDQTGNTWPVGPWYLVNNNSQEPTPLQGDAANPIVVHDPMTGARVQQERVPIRAGDRILVLKYLYAMRDPERYDVVVFKNPANTGENYIKRLIGLPGEQLALVDGDVFTRAPAPGEEVPSDPLQAAALWRKPDWRIARKPDDATRSLWQPVFDSTFAPEPRPDAATRPFRGPWVGLTGDSPAASRQWEIEGRRSYRFTGDGPARLRWSNEATFIANLGRPGHPPGYTWEIVDRYPYDEVYTQMPRTQFPVSDLRMRLGLEAPAASAGKAPEVTAQLTARGHVFQARIGGGKAVLERRPVSAGADNPMAGWETLGSADLTLPTGRVVDLEFWHVDQSLSLFVEGRKVVSAAYNWTPAERIEFTTGAPIEKITDPNDPKYAQRFASGLSDPSFYRGPSLEWRFSGGPFTLHRVGVDRDLHYRADMLTQQRAGWATTPRTTMRLGESEFFVCGDNSPASQDGRLWTEPEEWVRQLVDGKPGVVPRRLLLGKAFFVYFPALAGSSPVPMPDFGRLRFVR